ncbi:MAG: hypothetical protein IJ343_02960 [Clostridia bacterium]|nr:hypothetical protein [Clostridia bacterium]
MAATIIRLADGLRSAVDQILLTEPDSLLADGRILPFLNKLSTCTAGGRCAWELLFSSSAGDSGIHMDSRLIFHTSLPPAQHGMLTDSSQAMQDKLLAALEENDIAAAEAADKLPALPRRGLISLVKRDGRLISPDVELTPGHLRQHLCTAPGNGMSLLLVQSGWDAGELEQVAAGESDARRAMMAKDPAFSFVVTLWGPQAQENARWLQGLSMDQLTACVSTDEELYPIVVRRDPWRAIRLLPETPGFRATRLSLSELLTVCGCPAEPGEMQSMCRSNWRDQAMEALNKAQISLLPVDMTLTPNDLAYLGIQSDADLTGSLHMTAKMAEMLRMCMAILRQLGAIRLPGEPRPESAAEGSHLLSYLLPAVGHIYEQFVRECCYNTMYVPYYAHACGRSPRQVGSVILSTYDQGPDARFYRLKSFDPSMRDPEKQGDIRERMIDDFAAYATIRGEQMTDVYWYNLFNDMNTARSQRNEMAHELADVRVAEIFARAFLLEQPGEPSLLRRLLMCRWVATNFPRL